MSSSRLLRTPPPPEGARRLVRIGPDSDLKLLDSRIVGGNFQVGLNTQPGRSYEVRRRCSLSSPAASVVAGLAGDGYRQEVEVPADEPVLFLELQRQ